MSINSFKWEAPPKALEFSNNDIVEFLIEKYHDNHDASTPQLTLEVRVIRSEKDSDLVGEKTLLYFPFTKKDGTPNNSTYYFLLNFFKDELENHKPIPYETLLGQQFKAVAGINVSKTTNKSYVNWSKYKKLEDNDSGY